MPRDSGIAHRRVGAERALARSGCAAPRRVAGCAPRLSGLLSGPTGRRARQSRHARSACAALADHRSIDSPDFQRALLRVTAPSNCARRSGMSDVCSAKTRASSRRASTACCSGASKEIGLVQVRWWRLTVTEAMAAKPAEGAVASPDRAGPAELCRQAGDD